jgi:hypothetical protein
MQGLIVLGSLASVAAIIIIVVKNWPATQDVSAGATDGTVSRHQITLTHEQAGELSSELSAVRGDGGVVNFFVDKDNVLQVTVHKQKVKK